MSKLVTFITIVALAIAGTSGTTYAQTNTATNPSSGADSGLIATVSPEKQKLINHILELWHVENVGLIMLQKPVEESLRQSRSLLQGRVSSELQEATMKEINQDTIAFVKETAPIVLDSAKKLIPSIVSPMLAEKFSEEELRQIIAILESPVKSKFEKVAPEIEAALGKKIATENGAKINPKMGELTEKIGMRMRNAITPQ